MTTIVIIAIGVVMYLTIAVKVGGKVARWTADNMGRCTNIAYPKGSRDACARHHTHTTEPCWQPPGEVQSSDLLIGAGVGLGWLLALYPFMIYRSAQKQETYTGVLRRIDKMEQKLGVGQ